MNIPGYKYLTHKIITRPWGVECRFAVRRDNEPDFNDIVMVSSEKADEKELVELIVARLKLCDRPKDQDIVSERTYTETEVKRLLIEKGYLTKDQGIVDLKTAGMVK
jgi:hypothetical protein